MKLTRSQIAVMNYLDKGWMAYATTGNRVEVNGKQVCTAETMAVLERKGLVQREGVAAWKATEAGRQWKAQSRSNVQ